MSQAERARAGDESSALGWLRGPLARGSREAALIVATTVALYLVLSFATYDSTDPGWSHAGHAGAVRNEGGVVGAWLADVFLYLFGFMAFLFPVMVAYSGWLVYRDGADPQATPDIYHWVTRGAGFVMTLAAGCGIATLHHAGTAALPLDAGGVLGNLVGGTLEGGLNPLGASLALLAMFLTGFTLFTGLSWLTVMDVIGALTLRGLGQLERWARDGHARWSARAARQKREAATEVKREKKKAQKPPRIEPKIEVPKPSVRAEKERQKPLFEPPPAAPGELPALSLLDEPPPSRRTVSDAALEAMSRQVELKLADFGVEVEVVAVHPGPVITRFELQPAPGLKVSKVSNLAKDLARSLSTVSVRIVEVIPGKSVIGLEIPNEVRDLVCLSEVLRSQAYERVTSPLCLALGKDIAGQPTVVDLAQMPHLLVAGTTGSGKSVAVNAMILSLLYKSPASDVRMIMIDPKMLELSVYEGIPHLLAPVVTDMKQAGNALRWCVAEMERRYRLMSKLGVRNIGGYNRKVRDAIAKGEPIPDPFAPNLPMEEGDAFPARPTLEPLPYIVVLVDELADMMMVTGKKVEELIARLAQKARASGIHLILATQRPSVDVITGLIKANIPSRIAFQVSSKIDSRTILDQSGAESLLGHGDMLYVGPGMATPNRVHGAFVSDAEVHRVVKSLKQQGEPNYLDEILEGGSDGGGANAMLPGLGLDGDDDGEGDPLYDQAVHIVTETRRASISGVQRRLKIGYNRAARMLEQMEESGVVGPLQSNGAREVLAPPPPSD